jgi:hypothetical protein
MAILRTRGFVVVKRAVLPGWFIKIVVFLALVLILIGVGPFLQFIQKAHTISS